MAQYPRSVARLIDALERLPGVGPKTAQRLALWLLRNPAERMVLLADALRGAADNINLCERCGNFSEGPLCGVCSSERREASVICVVADPRDLLAIEDTGTFNGRYHVLHGVLSPIEGVGPEDLNLEPLLDRARQGEAAEFILALNPTPEGDTTANYLARLLKPLGVRVTRPALGLPVGGDLNYADRVTLERALAGRQEL